MKVKIRRKGNLLYIDSLEEKPFKIYDLGDKAFQVSHPKYGCLLDAFQEKGQYTAYKGDIEVTTNNLYESVTKILCNILA